MCVYRRTLFASCNHSQWSPKPFRICEQQHAYIAGKSSGACTQAMGHPLATIKVEAKCPQCAGAHRGVDEKLREAKAVISETKKTLIGADERCKTILEDAGAGTAATEDEGDVDLPKEGVEAPGAKEPSGQMAAQFLKRRKESDSANLFM
jgi:hypothetical protein